MGFRVYRVLVVLGFIGFRVLGFKAPQSPISFI